MQQHDLALELLAMARRDEYAASVLLADASVDDAIIGFHWQQTAEKLLKALLAERSVDFPRTHDLVLLMRLVRNEGYQLPESFANLGALNPFAATLRYDMSQGAGTLDREHTQSLVEQLRSWVEAQLHARDT